MGNSPITLDFSKAQPIAQAAPASQAQPVTLDFSKAQPISGQAPDDFESQQDEAKQLVEHGESPAAAYMKPKQTAGALGGMLAAGSTAGAAAGLTAPTVATEAVGTGVLDAAGEEIMREGIKYGPSALAKAMTSPVGKEILNWAIKGGASAVGGGAVWKALKTLGVF